MDSIMDSIMNESVKNKINSYGAKIVDYIITFIKIIIGFAIVYLLIQRLPGHGDKDHTMYYNLLIVICIYSFILLIDKYGREPYESIFKHSNSRGGFFRVLAGSGTESWDDTFLSAWWLSLLFVIIFIGIKLFYRVPILWTPTLSIDSMPEIAKNSFEILLVAVPYRIYLALLYYILIELPISPVNLFFGDISENTMKLYKDKSNVEEVDIEITNRSYIMYLILVLLIFLTIIIKLTSDTQYNLDNFQPGEKNGYYLTLISSMLMFFILSYGFRDSLMELQPEEYKFKCPMVNEDDKEIYKNVNGSCVGQDVDDVPICDPSSEIIVCKEKEGESEKKSILDGCLAERGPLQQYIKGVGSDPSEKIKIDLGDDGKYKIADDNKIELNSKCMSSINKFLSNLNTY
jgi:hypothetical protein